MRATRNGIFQSNGHNAGHDDRRARGKTFGICRIVRTAAAFSFGFSGKPRTVSGKSERQHDYFRFQKIDWRGRSLVASQGGLPRRKSLGCMKSRGF